MYKINYIKKKKKKKKKKKEIVNELFNTNIKINIRIDNKPCQDIAENENKKEWCKYMNI